MLFPCNTTFKQHSFEKFTKARTSSILSCKVGCRSNRFVAVQWEFDERPQFLQPMKEANCVHERSHLCEDHRRVLNPTQDSLSWRVYYRFDVGWCFGFAR